MKTSTDLMVALEDAFGYTNDNNRDVINDVVFPLSDVIEELEVQKAYQLLLGYILRNREMIDVHLDTGK